MCIYCKWKDLVLFKIVLESSHLPPSIPALAMFGCMFVVLVEGMSLSHELASTATGARAVNGKMCLAVSRNKHMYVSRAKIYVVT